MVKKNKNAVALSKKNLLSELEKEINEEFQEKIKTNVKDKMKQIKMMEITLAKMEKELDDVISGKKTITEESLLFN